MRLPTLANNSELPDQYEISIYADFSEKGYTIGYLYPLGSTTSSGENPRHDIRWLIERSKTNRLIRPLLVPKFPVQSFGVDETVTLVHESEDDSAGAPIAVENPRFFKIRMGPIRDDYAW